MLFLDITEYIDSSTMAITQQQQTHLNEIIETLADGKITMEEACSLFKEWTDELDADTDKLKALQDAVSNAEKELAQVKAESAARMNSRNSGSRMGIGK
jgi:uncharacterized phage infection (PIP) family protein YhgE